VARHCGKTSDSTIGLIALFNRFHAAETDKKRSKSHILERCADNAGRVLLLAIGWQRIILQRRIEKVVHALVNKLPQAAARYEETRVYGHALFERTGESIAGPQIVLIGMYYMYYCCYVLFVLTDLVNSRKLNAKNGASAGAERSPQSIPALSSNVQ
jgi:hypothetical protein